MFYKTRSGICLFFIKSICESIDLFLFLSFLAGHGQLRNPRAYVLVLRPIRLGTQSQPVLVVEEVPYDSPIGKHCRVPKMVLVI